MKADMLSQRKVYFIIKKDFLFCFFTKVDFKISIDNQIICKEISIFIYVELNKQWILNNNM